MSEGMRGDVFVYFGGTDSLFYGTLEDAFVEVVAHGFSRLRVAGSLGCREYILPCGFAVGVGIFAFEGIGEMHFTIACLQVSLVDVFDVLDVFLEGQGDAFGKGNRTVAFTFAIMDDDLAVGEVYIFDAKAETFHEPKARTE